VNVPELQQRLEAAWSLDTTQTPERYDAEHPAAGQCCVSSLVVRDVLGGVMLRGVTNRGTVHYWNELPSGAWYDATRAQFDDEEVIVVVQRDYDHGLYWFRDTIERYHALADRVLLPSR
jgi:hypothetical protein